MNTLYYGDNLEIMKQYLPDESVDLIYLDPPFQSGRNYNIIFRPEKGGIKGATSQIKTFEDTWNWGQEAEREYLGQISGTITKEFPPQKLIDLMKAMRSYLDACPLMAYLCMMAPRLLEMKRVLKPTGSIYLHCDPTASHYLKILMDAVFGESNFRNEVIWHYKRWPAKHNGFQRMHDVILFYTAKHNNHVFNTILEELSAGTIKRWKGKKSKVEFVEDVRQVTKMTDEFSLGRPMDDVWDIAIINSQAKERLGYPTQKPEALLERIIKASSNEGDIILDPFCGCGTAVAVAERLNRKWVGIDITYLSIDVIIKRFEKNGIMENQDFKVKGTPKDVHSATKLSETAPFQFEVWAVSQLNATPTVKSGDKGVDGVINFVDISRKDMIGKGIISVKGGKSLNPGMVRDLKGTLESQNGDFGILITLVEPTKGMIEEAAKAGDFEFRIVHSSLPVLIPRIQIITAEQLFMNPIPVALPQTAIDPYKKPEIKKNKSEQEEIEF